MSKLHMTRFAKLQGVIFALLGILAGLIYAVGGLIYDLISTGSLNTGTALAFLALIGMPVLFAAAGWILGALGVLLINRFPTRLRGSILKDRLIDP